MAIFVSLPHVSLTISQDSVIFFSDRRHVTDVPFLSVELRRS